ncbi:MAG: EamA family transporter [Desulfobulbaceae bacterium]|nr:EamA family transporter [Desulfobulbaceae bacterium]
MEGKHHTAKLLAIGLTSACLFGAATPASKALLSGIQPQVLAGLLYLGAALGVLPAVARTKSFAPPWCAGRQTLLLLTGAIVLGGILGPLLLLLGLKAASSGSVALWLNLEFVATVILGHYLFHEHLTARGWIAASGTLLAAMLITGGEGFAGVLPVLFVAAACLCWGFDNHFTALIDGITPAQITLWKGLVAGAFNLIIGGYLAGAVGKPQAVLPALLVGSLCYGMSVTLYIITAQGLGASRSQMIFSTAPFFGVLLSVIVLGEAFTWIQAMATGIIAASLVLLFTEKHAHIHRHDAIIHQHAHNHLDGHHDGHEHSDLAASESHVHRHEHDSVEHAHKHWPDLHHRHSHADGQECEHSGKQDGAGGSKTLM